MQFIELAKKRYSVRAYKPDPIEDEKLNQVLEVVRLAPTACNLQPFRFIVINTKGKEEELRRIYNTSWFVQAPLIICACVLPSESGKRKDGKKYCELDVAIAMDHLIMAATELGLGTCWIGAFDPQAAHDVLKLPDNLEPIIFTPLGYPDDQPKPKSRKTIDELVKHKR